MQTFHVPRLSTPLTLDGQLDEPIYKRIKPYTEFVYPWEPNRTPPATKAWLFWDEQYLYACFDVEEKNIVSAPPASTDTRSVENKEAVLNHCRSEIFLWNGDTNGTYYGLEINPHGLTLDYEARFHRQFNRDWFCDGLTIGTQRDSRGYRIEAGIPLDTLAREGYDLRKNPQGRVGLYRAEKKIDDPDDFHWSCLVNPQREEIDFHIPETFGTMILHPDESSAQAE